MKHKLLFIFCCIVTGNCFGGIDDELAHHLKECSSKTVKKALQSTWHPQKLQEAIPNSVHIKGDDNSAPAPANDPQFLIKLIVLKQIRHGDY